MVLRLMLDVNVWVNHYLSFAKGRTGSAAQQLAQSAFEGHCRLGPVQPIISHAMLDTLQEVLVRVGLSERFAETARDLVETSATDGIVGVAPHLVLAGGVQAVRDVEDQGVLEAAIAGGADLMVTNNMEDFTPGPRAHIDAAVVSSGVNRKADVLLFKHAKLPDGLVIASVFASRSWLLGGQLPPAGILARFLPQPTPETLFPRPPGAFTG